MAAQPSMEGYCRYSTIRLYSRCNHSWRVWTFFLFIHNRLDRPRLQITQRISHIPISNDRNLLLVDEILSNPSSVLLDLKNGGVRVVQIAPLPAAAKTKVESNQHLVDSDKNKAGNVWRIIEERHHVWD